MGSRDCTVSYFNLQACVSAVSRAVSSFNFILALLKTALIAEM